ncbi:MAG TPA: TonB-dependent receptor [Blastocatellia bacterium]|nr:TonB-dependent receptor [Blastocatellia bacterium]
MRRFLATVVFAASLMTWLDSGARPSAAQTAGSLSGRITDSQGSAIPGARLIITSRAGLPAISLTAISEPDGSYRLGPLPAGNYRLTIEKTGFQLLTRELGLRPPSEGETIDFKLTVSEVSETINIVADAGVLTAAKLDVPLRELPISLGRIDHQTLEAQGQNDLVSALRNISSVNSYTGYGVYEYYRVRGFADAVQLLDGVRNEGNRMNTQLNSIESVEVLKGPASVLYGGGAIGGAINLVRKKPQSDPAYDFTLAGGSFSTKRLAGGATGQLFSERLLGRIDGGFEDADGWRDNRARRFNLTPSVLWLITPRDQINFHLTINRDRFATDAGIPVVNGQVPEIPLGRRFNTPQDFALSEDYNGRIYYTHLFSDRLQFRDTLSYRYFEDEYFSAETLSVTPPNLNLVNRQFLYFKHHRRPVFNQAEASWRFKTGFQHQLIGGWEYQRFFNFSDRSAAASTATRPIDLFKPVETHVDRDFPLSRIDYFANTFNAIYLQDQLNLTRRLKAMLGVRFDIYRRWSRNDPVTNGRQLSGERIERAREAPTYRAGAVYQAKEWWTLYGSFATSFTPVNVVPFNQITLQPEEGRQFELGQRFDLLERRLNLTVAGYEIERRNLAVQVRSVPIIDPQTGQSLGTGQIYDQAAKQRSRGVEFDLTGQPLKRVPNLQVMVNYGYTDTKFLDYVSPSNNFIYTGKEPNFVPRHVGNLWATYRWKNGFGGGLGGRYLSRVFTSNENDIRLGGYATWDATAFYRRERWEFNVNFYNALNKERYFVGGIYRTQLYPGRPFNWLMTLRFRSK